MSHGTITIVGLLFFAGILYFITRFYDSKNKTLKGFAFILGFILLAIMFFGSNDHI